ncbi:MAG TPA: DegT/DnrJ/EryC1/StrS family aminotransferase [Methylomirabilota bacterium]|nr:DegT/DnrJ/EryC1/StrS family aminotransferase [Methylomirabilota bacterium]
MELMPIIRPTLPEFRELEELVRESWEAGLVTTGRIVRAFEQEVCRQTGAREAVAMSSCTAGLMLAARALELPAGSEVIVPSFTFAATAQALSWNGLVPVFCECRPDTLTLDPADVERNLTSKTAAICAAYVFGLPPDIEALTALGARHGIPVYFDSAQGLGAEYQGRKVGGFGACEIFSLSPTKVVTAIEGGIVCSNDPAMAARLRSMRDYGKDPKKGEDMVHLGLSARMSELHAAVGLLSLRRVDELVKARRQLIEVYRGRLGALPGCRVQDVPPDRASSGNYFVLFITARARAGRDDVYAALAARGIQSKRYFYPPLHEQTVMRRAAHRVSERMAHTVTASREALALPLYSHMTLQQIDRVCREVEDLLA